MPYSVPRRRGNSIRLAALGSSDSDAPIPQEEPVQPLRLLHSLPTNVIIHSPSPSPSPRKQQKAKAASQPTSRMERQSPSHSAFGLPTPPHSHSNDVLESRQSATPDRTSKRLSHKTPPRSSKRLRESSGMQERLFTSASKRRAVQAESPRAVYSGPRPGEQSPSKKRNSPTKTLASDRRRTFQLKRSEDGDDETYSNDRIILLPTKRTRDMSKSRLMENANSTFDSDLPEDSRRILFESELRQQQQQQREEEEENQQPEPQYLVDEYPDLMQEQYGGTLDLGKASARLELEDSMPIHQQNASSPSIHASTPPVKAISLVKRMYSSPRPSSPAIHISTPIDIPLSPSHHRERLSSNQRPMESTPFRLGTKKVGGRRSTPHPGQEGKVRASLAALDSPHRAQRVRKDEDEIALDRAMRTSSVTHTTFSREVSMELDTNYLVPTRPPERELSTILAIEMDGDSDENDDLSHFTVEPSRLKVETTSKQNLRDDVMVYTTSKLWAQGARIPEDESEEIDADDFIYETVLAEEDEQQPSRRQEESIASSRDSSPVLMDVQYNPEGDMNLEWAEVQRKKYQMQSRNNMQRHLTSRRNDSLERDDDDAVERAEEEQDEQEVRENDSYTETEEGEDSQKESMEEVESEQSEEDEEAIETVILEEERDDESMGEEDSLGESEDEETDTEEDGHEEQEQEQNQRLELVEEEGGSDEELSMEDERADESSEEEFSGEDEEAEEVMDKGTSQQQISIKRHVPTTEFDEHHSQSIAGNRSGNASRVNRFDSVLMDSTINNSLWRSFTERTRLLTARPGAVEVSSMNRDNAARATAILTLFHKYVQYGVLDVEIDDEEIEASMHHHALAQEASAFRQLLSQHGVSDADKTLSEVLAEKESEIKRNCRKSRLQSPSTPLLTATTRTASPKTPLLPGAFPQSSAKTRVLNNELHLSPEKIIDKSFRHCPPSQVNLAVFAKHNWRALESVVKSEITATARASLVNSKIKQEEALLRAALELDYGHLAQAFLDAYKVPSSSHSQVREWSKDKVQSKVASLVRTFLVSLQEKYPDLGIDANAMANATFLRAETSSRKEIEVDESGVVEASLHVPFKMVTQSTPAPLSRPAATQNESSFSPSLDRGGRSDGINLYPRLPKPLPPFNAEWKRSQMSKAPLQAQSQEESAEKNGDTSRGLTGLASRSLGYVYASMGWNKATDAEVKERPTEVVDKTKGETAARLPARLPRSTFTSSTSTLDQTSVSYNRSQSQISYGNGSSRLIRSGVSSSVDPTALALLSPHTHELAKAKVQQFKDSRKRNNWRSPRHDRIPDTSNSSLSRLR